jgi:hypothetical protein
MTEQDFDTLDSQFFLSADAGLAALLEKLKDSPEHHAYFRALLLKKRHELKLPLVNPGDLRGVPPEAKREYEDYVETICREIGTRYLAEKDIVQAWRYFRTIGDHQPIREALEQLDPKTADDTVLDIAINQGVHPLRGFAITLERDGLCRAVSTYDMEFSSNLDDKRGAAALLVQAIYRDLVLNVRRQIYERFNEYPPETDLIELVQHRPWLFEDGNYHTDPSHLSSICRIGIILTTQPEQIMALSCCEYGKLLDKRHQYEGRAPFEAGYADLALFYRAALGQNVPENIAFFKEKLTNYDLHSMDSFPLETVLLLQWHCGQRSEALHFWRENFRYTAPEQQGQITPSYYDLCVQAGDFQQLAEVARNQSDSSAWAAARIMMG